MINYIKAHVFNSSDAAFLLANDEKSTKFAIRLITKKLEKVRISSNSFSPYKIQKYERQLSFLRNPEKDKGCRTVANSNINSVRVKDLSKTADIRQRPEFKEMAAKISERKVVCSKPVDKPMENVPKQSVSIEVAKNSPEFIKEMAERLAKHCDSIILNKIDNTNYMSRSTVTLLKYFSELQSKSIASQAKKYLEHTINGKKFNDFGDTEICKDHEVNEIKILLKEVKSWASNIKSSV
ncbi:hypothetical protein [Kalamiella sp. sgz302252]|uniref:hypothetical protein n=1 Tax=Pantoea sp. sgz302252 TaxID=3341827 RepID=UPI0036D27F1C